MQIRLIGYIYCMHLAVITAVFLISAIFSSVGVRISLMLPSSDKIQKPSSRSSSESLQLATGKEEVQDYSAINSNPSAAGLISMSNLQLSSSDFKFPPIQFTPPPLPSTHGLACICKEGERIRSKWEMLHVISPNEAVVSPREIEFPDP